MNIAECLERSWAAAHLLINSVLDELQKQTGLSGDFIKQWFDWKNQQQGYLTVR